MAHLTNLSRAGILLETPECMIPGGIVYLRLIAADAVFLLKGRVLRSRPSLMRNLNRSYESTVSFDGAFPRPVESGIGVATREPVEILQGGHETRLFASHGNTEAFGTQTPTTYMVTAAVPRSGPDLNQIFGLNSW